MTTQNSNKTGAGNLPRKVAQAVMSSTSRAGMVSWLFGPDNVGCRQNIMEAITGQRLAKSKCGITAVMNALYSVFPVTEFSCIADRERKLGKLIENALCS